MDLKLSGRVIEILDEQSGEGKNGSWRKRDFILETKEKFPKKVCITQWGDNIDNHAIQKGIEVTAYIDIQSREFKGNWYTDVKAWKVEHGTGESNVPPQSPQPPAAQGFEIDSNTFDDLDDDLPF